MTFHPNFKLSLFHLLLISITSTTANKLLCPPLPSHDESVIVSCEVSKDNNTKIPCQGPLAGVPQRTIAKYRCASIANDSTITPSSENVIVCKCKGKWKGLDAFESFKNTCITFNAQKNFSLNGPAELNFNPDVMERLTSIASENKEPGYAEDALAYQNYYRGLHGSNMLKLNSSLMAAAQRRADMELTGNNTNKDGNSSGHISNIFWLSGPSNFDYRKAVKLAIGRWYEDSQVYDYQVPVANAFSAMVWNSSTDLGVGVSSKGNQLVVVCDYWPPGNVYVVNNNQADPETTNDNSEFDPLALFKKNVHPPVNSSEQARVTMLARSNINSNNNSSNSSSLLF